MGHDHVSEETGHRNDHGKDLSQATSQAFLVEYESVMKGLVALGGIYLLFIVEHCLQMFKHYKEGRVSIPFSILLHFTRKPQYFLCPVLHFWLARVSLDHLQ